MSEWSDGRRLTRWRGLTIRQPWLHLITHHGKDVENRTLRVSPALLADGPARVMLHAGLKWDPNWHRGKVGPMAPETTFHRTNDGVAYHRTGCECSPGVQPFGHVIAVANISGSHPQFGEDPEFGEPCCLSPWGQPDVHHWELTDVQLLEEPVRAVGMLGLWRPDEATVESVEAQLPDD